MRQQRNQQWFYSERVAGDQLWLDEQEAVHCSLVLRKREGDIIQVLDGKGNRYKCGIDRLGKREVECSILDQQYTKQKKGLHLAVAPTKNRDRLEWLVEKAVELGVKEIILMNTQRTERSRINHDRLQKKAIAAMKQSLRHWLPPIVELEFAEVLNLPLSKAYIAHCMETEEQGEAQLKGEECLALIGPEGDFTVDELTLAKSKGLKNLDLGEARLRTETAAIAAAVLANI